MTVAELIDVLKTMPVDHRVVVYDNEWGIYDEILSAKVKEADVSAYLNDSTVINLYPKGDTPTRYSNKIDNISIVEIISSPGRLE